MSRNGFRSTNVFGSPNDSGAMRECARNGFLCWALLLAVLPSVVAGADDAPPRPVIATGEVVGDDVYVRSGPSMNHYTVCKLDAGQRVAILGERGAWYEIIPPEGVSSLISGEYVDSPDGKTGVVNGNNVRVRAGSLLNGSKYTVQTMLSRGADVTIVGKDPRRVLADHPPFGSNALDQRCLSRNRTRGTASAGSNARCRYRGGPNCDANRARR